MACACPQVLTSCVRSIGSLGSGAAVDADDLATFCKARLRAHLRAHPRVSYSTRARSLDRGLRTPTNARSSRTLTRTRELRGGSPQAIDALAFNGNVDAAQRLYRRVLDECAQLWPSMQASAIQR
jgi:hypothetical protein